MLHDLADAVTADDAGGKARGLAWLIAAGLPVPPGFVVPGAAFTASDGGRAEPAPALAAAVIARARALGPRLAVRSSMAFEDGATRAAPGLGTTVLGVAPDAVWPAIRAVWSAATAPAVIAYARGRDGDDAAIAPPAVVVQAEVAGYRATVYTRPPGRPDADEVWIGSGAGAPERIARTAAELAGARWREAIALALAAERAIAAPGGADVELVWSLAEQAWVIVQARPLIHPPPRARRPPPPPLVLAPLRTPPRAWRRDVTHNPAPLSVAQAELCARVEAAAIAPFHLAVAAGHLYSAARPGVTPPAPIASTDDFAARVADAERAVTAILDAPAEDSTVAAAVARYLAAYRILAGELGPLIALGRTALIAHGASPAIAAALTARRPSSIAARLAAAARGELSRAELLAAIGDAATAWDVCAPTFAEAPQLLDDALARAAARPTPPPEPPTPAGLDEPAAIARAAADASERDDLLYWRAQASVRRALLAAAARARLADGDVFWIALADADDPALDRVVVHGRATAARRAAERAAAWDFPLALDGDGDGASPSAPATSTSVWRGAGVGPIARGPIHHADVGAPIPRGAVALVRAVTPALAIALDGAAAIVSEHGTPLDHGAAMARELGIPCVVGCPGIVDALAEGAWVTVDGDRGTVTAA